MDELINVISTVGFPIAMCTYMTVVVNKTMEDLKNAVTALNTTVSSLISKDGDE